MPVLHYQKILPFSKQQLFDLVLDINSYKEFLPRCVASDVISAKEGLIIADLTVEFSHLREKYRSEVCFQKNDFISSKAISGPFQYLHSQWKFEECSSSETIVDFSINFELKFGLFNMIINMVLEDDASKMLQAFEIRARNVYLSKS